MNSDTATIKARDLRTGMVLDNGLAITGIEQGERKGHLRVTTDRAETPRGDRSFDIHGGTRVRVSVDSFRANR